MNRAETGRRGESLAAAHYRKSGCKILATNYRTRMGEIDLVVQDGQMLVFAEVKTRGAGSIATPREWVDARKQRRIILAAQHYLMKHKSPQPPCRFDVVEVVLPAVGKPSLHCIQNAFSL